MAGLIGRGWWGARRTSRPLDLPPPSARALFVSVVALLVGLMVISNTQVWPALADGLGSRVSWFGVLAAAECGFMAAMCASRGFVSRPNRLLACAGASTTVYALVVLISYQHAQEPWLTLSTALWPSIPLGFAFWARASFAVTGEMRRTRVGVPRMWARIDGASRRLSRPRVRIFLVRVPRAELALIWAPCLAFSVANWVPGFMFDPATGVDWTGWGYQPHWPYLLFACWAMLVLVVATLVVEAAWQSRHQGTFAGVLVRARGARVATKLGIVAVAALFLTGFTGNWPEPLLDVPLGALLLFYALRCADADSYRDAVHAYSSIRRRWIWAVGWIGASVIFAAGFQNGPFMSGVYAAMIASLYPLFPAGLRAKEGIPQELAEGPRRRQRLPAAAADELASHLSGTAACPPAVPTDAVRAAHNLIAGLTVDDYQLLVGGLPKHDGRKPPRDRDPREYPHLRSFIAELPLLDAYGAFDARLDRFVRAFDATVMFDPVVSAALRRRGTSNNPSRQWVSHAYCLQRISLAETSEEELEEERIGLMYTVWLRRKPKTTGGRGGIKHSDDRPSYDWAGDKSIAPKIVNMTIDELREAKNQLKGRGVYEGSKKYRDRGLEAAYKRIQARWLALLDQLLYELEERTKQ